MFMSDFQRVKAISKSPFEIFSELSITFSPFLTLQKLGIRAAKSSFEVQKEKISLVREKISSTSKTDYLVAPIVFKC